MTMLMILRLDVGLRMLAWILLVSMVTVTRQTGIPNDAKCEFKNKKHYCLLNGTFNLDDARNACNFTGDSDRSYDLLKVNDIKQHQFVSTFLTNNSKTKAWLGINVTYFIISGLDVAFRSLGNTTDILDITASSRYQCLALTVEASTFKKTSHSCNEIGTCGFLCKYPGLQDCGSSTFGNFKSKTTQCMSVVPIPMSWYSADRYCQNKGGRLATYEDVDSGKLAATIKEMKENGYFPLECIWVRARNHEMQWLDSSYISRYFWKDDEPPKDGGSCVTVNKIGDQLYWKTQKPCTTPFPVICTSEDPYSPSSASGDSTTTPTGGSTRDKTNEVRSDTESDQDKKWIALLITTIVLGALLCLVIVIAIFAVMKLRSRKRLESGKAPAENPAYQDNLTSEYSYAEVQQTKNNQVKPNNKRDASKLTNKPPVPGTNQNANKTETDHTLNDYTYAEVTPKDKNAEVTPKDKKPPPLSKKPDKNTNRAPPVGQHPDTELTLNENVIYQSTDDRNPKV